MTIDEFPEPRATKPLWLITLADLALLLVGFFVLVQATQHGDRRALAKGLRDGFAGTGATAHPEPEAIPVAAAGLIDFAPGSALLPASATGLVAWAREAARDPRVTLTITGSTDGSVADVDQASGSAAVLAADRARALAAALAPVIPAGHLVITSATRPGRRAAIATLAFTGEKHP